MLKIKGSLSESARKSAESVDVEYLPKVVGMERSSDVGGRVGGQEANAGPALTLVLWRYQLTLCGPHAVFMRGLDTLSI